MKNAAALTSIIVAAVTCGAAGYVMGARSANSHEGALVREVQAMKARDTAGLLQLAREGHSQVAVRYLESSLDTHFVNLSDQAAVASLSSSARNALRVAASYRERYPAVKVNPDWDARVLGRVQLAR